MRYVQRARKILRIYLQSRSCSMRSTPKLTKSRRITKISILPRKVTRFNLNKLIISVQRSESKLLDWRLTRIKLKRNITKPWLSMKLSRNSLRTSFGSTRPNKPSMSARNARINTSLSARHAMMQDANTKKSVLPTKRDTKRNKLAARKNRLSSKSYGKYNNSNVSRCTLTLPMSIFVNSWFTTVLAYTESIIKMTRMQMMPKMLRIN